MQQQFSSRSYSVRDFEEWHRKGELVLAAKFQRRNVWSPKARSYLIDTIIRGKPIPKIYMRQDVNPITRRATREIVDGQQRLRSALNFLEDGFAILKVHNEEHGGKRFSQLDEEVQRDILRYEFSVDLLQDMPDPEVYDVFARLNTYSVTLNAQELRNAQYFGEFKTTVYALSNEFMTFWQTNGIFSDAKILRMAEAEFVSELLIAMSIGIRERSKGLIDGFYRDNDDRFPHRATLMKRFRDTMDAIGGIMGDTLLGSKFSESRLLYPLFCSVYHMLFDLPRLDCARRPFTQSDYPKLRIALDRVEDIFRKSAMEDERKEMVDAGEPEEEVPIEADTDEEYVGGAEEIDLLSPEERAFYNAYTVHWVHAENRRTLTHYICGLLLGALQDE
jgi:hypothetical protein